MTDPEIYSKVDEMRRYLREDEEVLASVLDVLAGRTSPHLKIQPPRDADPLKGLIFYVRRTPESGSGETLRGTMLGRIWGDFYLIQLDGRNQKEVHRITHMQHWEFFDAETAP